MVNIILIVCAMHFASLPRYLVTSRSVFHNWPKKKYIQQYAEIKDIFSPNHSLTQNCLHLKTTSLVIKISLCTFIVSALYSHLQYTEGCKYLIFQYISLLPLRYQYTANLKTKTKSNGQSDGTALQN